MRYREPLPRGCPPDIAEEIAETQLVFRLVRTDPPTAGDFESQRAEKPSHQFSGISECQARGLSVFAKRKDLDRVLKLPHLRGRFLCSVRLGAGAGRIQQTGQLSHHTWWPLAEFDILGQCAVEAP